MELNAYVYICGRKMDLKQLADVAAQKFIIRMNQLFSHLVRGIKALQIIHENTTNDDLCLRLYITRWCIDHHDVISSSPDLLSLIRMQEPTAWTIASEIQPQLEVKLKPSELWRCR
jgi:hypothetical protein